MLIPVTCPLCGAPDGAPCERCLARLPKACRPPAVGGLDGLAALWTYDGEARRLVASLKYRNARRVVRRLSVELAALVAHAPDCVTWVPAAPANRRARGYDQGEALARPVARRLGTRSRRLLTRRGRAQTGQGRSRRLAGPDLRARGPAPPHVLLVDDVVTTGSSLDAAARALRAAGAERVDALVLAARTDRTFGISTAAPRPVPSDHSSPNGG